MITLIVIATIALMIIKNSDKNNNTESDCNNNYVYLFSPRVVSSGILITPGCLAIILLHRFHCRNQFSYRVPFYFTWVESGKSKNAAVLGLVIHLVRSSVCPADVLVSSNYVVQRDATHHSFHRFSESFVKNAKNKGVHPTIGEQQNS